MKPIPDFNELALVLVAKEIIPTLLTSEFLKGSRIIPFEWEFAEPPQIYADESKVSFTNEVIISATNGSITFSENLDAHNLEAAIVPQLVAKWVKTLSSRFEYQVVQINPSSYFYFEQERESPFRHFIPDTLLIDADWKTISKEPLRGSLSLHYALNQKDFNLKIDDILLRKWDNSFESGVMFYGNFSYKVTGNTTADKVKNTYQLLDQWPEDFSIFQDLIRNKFLRL